MKLPLHPFELQVPIGKGGMGDVWRGIHVQQQVPVAVKVISGEQGRVRQFTEAFRHEVQAVACLSHPNIVMLFDYGEISEQTAERSSGRFEPGWPYLVMELASAGSLDRLTEPVRWSVLKNVLLTLLEALSHAHARGVVHRDLKPANILVATEDDIRPGLKITDFGIAHALDAHTRSAKAAMRSTESVAGSPHYMAPEQFHGRWREHGPWTDLYGLGCIAFQLATGQPPFDAATHSDLAIAHLNIRPPRVTSLVPVPDGFESWISRLLEKEPANRFQCAADAAWALTQVIGPDEEATTDSSWLADIFTHYRNIGSPNLAQSPLTLDEDPTIPDVRSIAEQIEQVTSDEHIDPIPTLIPDQPATWRQEKVTAPSMQLVGAGLGLYGLRQIPLVDRDWERDVIWSTLREVRDTGTVRLVLLQGPTGTGKSRLAEWICERAQEVGAATVLKAVHNPRGGPSHGLPRMLASYFRCVGLGREELIERVETVLHQLKVTDEYELNALAEIVESATERGRSVSSTTVRFASPTTRHVQIARLLSRLAKSRPVMVWIDDVQWGTDALAFCEHLLRAQNISPIPVLLLLTAQAESLAEHPVCAEYLAQVTIYEGAARLDVPPLTTRDHSELVRNLLCLEGGLAQAVEGRTAGNPLFAVQLVGDWVHRGILEVGETGFVLKPGERADLPDDIHRVWTKRIERLLEQARNLWFSPNDSRRPESASLALEIAATLGQHVDMDEWRAACEAANVALPAQLRDTLVSNRLASPTHEGWEFVHNMFRESIERLAKENGRSNAHNKACAMALAPRYERGEKGVARRLGNHLLAAHDLEAALTPLLDAARERCHATDCTSAHALLDKREAALTELGATNEDLRFAAGWNVRAEICNLEHRFDEATRWAECAEKLGRFHGHKKVLAEALAAMACALRRGGSLIRASALSHEAQRLFENIGDETGVAACTLTRAITARQQGDLGQAKRLYKKARALHHRNEELPGVAACLYGLGRIAQLSGEETKSQNLLMEAKNLYERLGNQQELANSLNVLAESARFRGDLDEAEVGYRQALTLQEAIGSGDALICRANIALVLLARNRMAEARQSLVALLEMSKKTPESWLRGAVHAALLPCAATDRDWAMWDHHFMEMIAILAETGIADPDIGDTAEMGARLACEAGDVVRAKQAFEAALEQWRRLGKFEKIQSVTQSLQSLG